MKLSDFFSYLTLGELAKLKIGGKDEGGIYPKYSDEVVSYITLGLSDLHTRFELNRGELVLKQFDGITEYPLKTKYSVSNTASMEPNKWIQDSLERPFLGDILTVQEVYDAEGSAVPVNKLNNPDSVIISQYDTIRFPDSTADTMYEVTYKSDHAPLDLSTEQPKNIDINIPASLIHPLTLYVASLAHNAVGSPEAIQVSLNKMQEYRAACVELEMQGSVRLDDWNNNRLNNNGWV